MVRSLPQLKIKQPQDVSPQDPSWLDWKWQAKHMLKTQSQFAERFELSETEKEGFRISQNLFRVGATPYYASLADPEHEGCPVRKQILPNPLEAGIREEELRDPLGEELHSPTPAVFHKYPDRCLLMVLDRCAIYCRHCNRRRVVGQDEPPTLSEIDLGIQYIKNTPRIKDVLLSGGDPLLLATSKLDKILEKLRAIPHVETIRIGTRLPVVMPMRVDKELCTMLQKHQPVFINTHFNHPKELTPLAIERCGMLVDHGILVGNQTVLLRGINSSVQTLRALFRKLLRSRIKPYYLFQGDTVLGTDHLRTPVDEAINLYGKLRGYINGMALPHLVLDAPHGGGKIPLLPSYLQDINDSWVTLKNYRGDIIKYPQPVERDCTVPYDEVYFKDVKADDDRIGAQPCEISN